MISGEEKNVKKPVKQEIQAENGIFGHFSPQQGTGEWRREEATMGHALSGAAVDGTTQAAAKVVREM